MFVLLLLKVKSAKCDLNGNVTNSGMKSDMLTEEMEMIPQQAWKFFKIKKRKVVIYFYRLYRMPLNGLSKPVKFVIFGKTSMIFLLRN